MARCGRPARRRRDRRRLGGALPAQRRRRPAVRPRSGGAAQGRRGARQRPPGAAPADRWRRCRPRGRSRFVGSPEEAADGVRLRAGERARADGAEAARCSPRPAPSPAPDVVIASSTSGLLPVRAAGRHDPPRAARRRPSVQPGVPAAAGRGGRRASDVATAAMARAAAVYRSVGMQPLRAAHTRSTASSPTGCSRRCGARRCGWSTTASRRSRRSTTRSASAPACAGASWARSSPTGSPAARPACATSWPSSGRRCSGRGRS